MAKSKRNIGEVFAVQSAPAVALLKEALGLRGKRPQLKANVVVKMTFIFPPKAAYADAGLSFKSSVKNFRSALDDFRPLATTIGLTKDDVSFRMSAADMDDALNIVSLKSKVHEGDDVVAYVDMYDDTLGQRLRLVPAIRCSRTTSAVSRRLTAAGTRRSLSSTTYT